VEKFPVRTSVVIWFVLVLVWSMSSAGAVVLDGEHKGLVGLVRLVSRVWLVGLVS